MAVLVGTILLMDLRLLGLGLRRTQVARLAGQLAPWTRAGLAIMLITGPVMFASDISRYSANSAFRVKMALLFAALLSHFTIHRQAIASGKGRFAAFLSILLWSCVALGGRAIADFDL
jgi:hypothetical protein